MGTSSRARVSVSHSSGNGGVKKKKKKGRGNWRSNPDPTHLFVSMDSGDSIDLLSLGRTYTTLSSLNINLLIAFDLENV